MRKVGLSCSALGKCARGKTSGRGRRVAREGDLWYEKEQGDRRTKAACCESDIGLGFARRVGSLLDFDSAGGIGACMTYSYKNVLIAMTEVKNYDFAKRCDCKVELVC